MMLRDYLDMINQFLSIENEKRSSLEEQQTHIRAGLQKLEETQEQVVLLRGEMVLKDNVLEKKDSEANEKLSQMLEKQKEAEQRKSLAENLTVNLNRMMIYLLALCIQFCFKKSYYKAENYYLLIPCILFIFTCNLISPVCCSYNYLNIS